MKRIEQHASFGGRQEVWAHTSSTLGCEMRVAVYLPDAALRGVKCPVLYWLSGLTCTEQNFITKAGAQAHAARHGVIVVAPDTSPRGEAVANDDAYDLGQGAGFYVNATQAPWAAHYRMQDYVADELPNWIEQHFAASDSRGIFGHSMGGHGALTLGLRHADLYKSVSAFAPIVAPASVPWGEKAFANYLGDDRTAWRAHDACCLLQDGKRFASPPLVDQGTADKFLVEQLQPERFEAVCQQVGQPFHLRRHEGYDHGYFFIASVVADHLRHHAQVLKG